MSLVVTVVLLWPPGWVRVPGALAANGPFTPSSPVTLPTPSRASFIPFLPLPSPALSLLGRIGVVAKLASTAKSATSMLTLGGVHVAANLDGITNSATPTPPRHGLCFPEGFADVDVIAELVATGKSVTPTTASLPPCALRLMRIFLCILLDGAIPRVPLILLLLPLPPILNPVWEDAFSKAVKQALLHAPRAVSLVAHRQDRRGRRWHDSGTPGMDGDGHSRGLVAALQLGAPSTRLVEGRSGSHATGAPATGLVWHPAIRAARNITIRASGDVPPVSPTGLR